MKRVAENAVAQIVFSEIKNNQGKIVATIATAKTRADVAVVVEKFEWGARFMKYVGERDEKTGCMTWIGCTSKKGYGYFNCEGKFQRVHRLLYRCLHGEAPGLIMHLCNNPACLNPDHLMAGTNSQNLEYRNLCGNNRYGENHPGCKITKEQLAEIRGLVAEGKMTQVEIGQMYGVSRSYVSAIKRGVFRSLD